MDYLSGMQAPSDPSVTTIARRRRRSPEELADRILAAAREEFKLHGLSGATTAAIARRADVTEAQLFRYFESKAELFREAVFAPLNRHLREFLEGQSEPPESADYRPAASHYITELHRFLNDNG